MLGLVFLTIATAQDRTITCRNVFKTMNTFMEESYKESPMSVLKYLTTGRFLMDSESDNLWLKFARKCPSEHALIKDVYWKQIQLDFDILRLAGLSGYVSLPVMTDKLSPFLPTYRRATTRLRLLA